MTSRMDDFRAALRSMDGRVNAFESATLLSIIAELRRGDVTDNRLGALQRPSRTAIGSLSARPTMAPTGKAGKYTAIVSAHGVALYSFEAQPFAFSTLTLARAITQLANDPTVENIIIDFDTPGGQVTGTQEAADAVWNARKKKPVVGIINPLCASAGYWIAAQCTSIVAVPSADVGSIGVFLCHLDQSKLLGDIGIKPTFIYAGPHKTEGNALEPLGADAKAFFQGEVNKTYADFVASVARGRGTTGAIVKDRMGGGRCLGAPDALKAGMIDCIQTPDAAVQQIASGAIPGRTAISPSAPYRAIIAAHAVDQMSPEQKHAAEVRRYRLAILEGS